MIRLLIRILGIVLGVIVLVVSGILVWFFYYSADLPDVKAVAQFTPAQTTPVSDPCLTAASVAIPYDSIGNNLRAALSAAEGGVENKGTLYDTYQEIAGPSSHSATLSMQISRTMFCTPSRTLDRELKELRTEVQLDRRFSRRDLVTIFANRTWFGDGQIGVKAASQHYFHKEPSHLQVAEAALLAGLIKAPAHFSPYMYPERALQRRNEVIDAMNSADAISSEEGEIAKGSDLGIAAR